ncbi:protein IQ-DOMAIN 1 isoform X1 [Dendrobium catenatum]|uniref:protein IQ-DOMAIN 1 isoform X1 n=1 Tax=Dendrobium catenatum TaxID=906689 RepID=UPI0009F51E6D|nr:protein IQ-DOMAIN 1 isoform X1 [Dendrobium catenatum]XP_020695172.1 protein IQ-DOMAIN 1 isoform X1 [Dendrobium catenatum]XP_020695173.1 protein IQ-DOMAIN 1 isoform X1 [Dendrobium catenatum]
MGKRGKKFLGAIKRIFSPESKEKKGEKSNKLGLGKSKHSNPYFSEKSPQNTAPVVVSPSPQPVHPLPQSEEIKLAETEQKQRKHVYSVTTASVAAVAATQADAEVVRFSSSANFNGNSREVAVIKIQTVFRGYLARRALRALKGLVRLKSLIRGNAVKRQAATTLRCMQTLARVQSQIRSRRIRMLEENQSLQQKLLLKREKELESILQMSEEWVDSMQSKEQIEASLLSKQEALVRRERALAYAFSHQWKNPSRSVNPTFMDTNNPQWGWSWLERWMAARPWENRSTTTDKELNSGRASMKSFNGGEINKAYSCRDGILDRAMPNTPQRSTRPPSRQSPATPPSKVISEASKIKSASPRNCWHPSDDTKSMISLQSERPRRHSLAGSSLRDDESSTNSVPLPSYMAPTESARAKNRFHGLLGDIMIESTTGKDSANSVKKRLSFPPSPAAVKRHSAPTRVPASVAVKSERNGSNMESR